MTDPYKERFGLSAEELTEEFSKLGNGGSALSEDFTVGEHWPTEGLSDKQIELLTSKLQKVESAKRREDFLGRLGLK